MAKFASHRTAYATTETSRPVAEDIYQIHEQQAMQMLVESCGSVYSARYTGIVRPDWELNAWVAEHFSDYMGYSPFRFVAFCGDACQGTLVRLDFLFKDNKFLVELHGRKPPVDFLLDWIKAQTFFSSSGISATWVYGQNASQMEEYERTLKVPSEIEGAYPWLGCSVKDLAEEFKNSTESVLILLGPPGTGKTTLVKQLAQYLNTGLMFTYDSVLLHQDGFFSSYMARDNCGILLLEDADDKLGSRQDGNDTMAKFLNASDGMMKIDDKKIVITTNLPNLADVDEALLRPGRCFGALTTRLHTRDEARALAAQLYTENYVEADWSKPEYSLAEIMNVRKTFRGKVRNKIGFLG